MKYLPLHKGMLKAKNIIGTTVAYIAEDGRVKRGTIASANSLNVYVLLREPKETASTDLILDARTAMRTLQVSCYSINKLRGFAGVHYTHKYANNFGSTLSALQRHGGLSYQAMLAMQAVYSEAFFMPKPWYRGTTVKLIALFVGLLLVTTLSGCTVNYYDLQDQATVGNSSHFNPKAGE